MPPRKHNPNNPTQYVTKTECTQISGTIKTELETIRTALVGEDMRGGLVKDVAELKSQGSTAILILKSVVVPIIVAVVTAVIISGIPR